jgi:hypothetical protein
MRRSGIENTPFRIFSDPKLEWMKRYSIDVGRWSVCVLAMNELGAIHVLRREVGPTQVCRLVSEIVQIVNEAKH